VEALIQRYFGVAQDGAGNALASPTVTVRLTGTVTAATLYSDNSYTVLANPFTGEADGTFQFYARDGRYDVVLAKTGYSFVADNTADVLLADHQSIITPAQITADQNDYAPANAINARTWRVSSDASRTITGITAGFSGQTVVLINVGAQDIVLANQSGSSVAANRLITGTGGNVTMQTLESAILWYDSVDSRWRRVGGIL
jgi:hypothetical protein